MKTAWESCANLVLIGMPGVGKSTCGVLLAKQTSRVFIDTDLIIQAQEGRRLQNIIDTGGLPEFCALESRYIQELQVQHSVIATGGSAVYCPQAMRHLRANGIVIHLDLPLPALRRRLSDLDSRGVVKAPGATLAQVYAERQPLYREYADISIDCGGKNHGAVVHAILEAVAATRG